MTHQRAIEKYSLDLTRNFGIITGLALTITLATQVLSRAGQDRVFQIVQAAIGSFLALLLSCIGVIYVFVQEGWNRTDGAAGARLPACLITGIAVMWQVLFLSSFFSRELDA